MPTLIQIHRDIDTRVAAIRESHPDWLCGKGCDECCRQLAAVPRLTRVEWEELRAGLATLSAERLGEIGQNMALLADGASYPLICPLLERATGACPVYAQRPVACRTYGFYVQRKQGVYCRKIESRVAEGALSDVVWGNHESVELRLAVLGEERSLTEWFNDWPRDGAPAGTA